MAQLELVNERALHRKIVRKRLTQGALAVAVIGIVGVCVHFYLKNPHTYEVVWEQNVDLSEVGNIQTFDDRVVLYDRNGASCYDKEGNQTWAAVYEINWPMVKRTGDYLAIADQKGRRVAICNKESGMTGMVYTEHKITSVDISQNGTVAVVTEDDTSSYIEYYDAQAAKIDVEFKSTIQEDGYPLDVALSPSGVELMVSYVAVDSGSINNSVSFYNFDMQQEKDDYVVALFHHYQESETLVPDVDFLSENEAVAIGDNRISFYSLSNLLETQIAKEYELTEEVQTVFKSTKYVGIVLDGEDGQKNVVVYGRDGSEVTQLSLQNGYENILFNKDYIVVTDAADCTIYNFSGDIYYEKQFANKLLTVEAGENERQYYALTGTQLQYIRLR